MTQKLCYILPKYNFKDTSHFSHVHDFLSKISESFDIFLFIEKGDIPNKSLGYKKVYRLFFSFLPLRLVETWLVLFFVRISGYRNFYVHYSFSSALISSILVKIFGGRTYYWNCGEPWKYKRNLIREIFEKTVYKLITFQVTGAMSLAKQYSDYYRIPLSKIKIMPNWIDLKRFSSSLSTMDAKKEIGIPENKKIILFVHHLSPRKGSRMILPVASEVVGSNPDAVFIVIGSGPDEDFLRKEILKTELSEKVLLLGSVPNKKIPVYFRAADVFFMPSEEEGFPRVILESMSIGVPFVASDVGSIKEVSIPLLWPYIVDSKNTSAFSGKLNELINKNQNEKKIISKMLIKSVQNYDVSVISVCFRRIFL